MQRYIDAMDSTRVISVVNDNGNGTFRCKVAFKVGRKGLVHMGSTNLSKKLFLSGSEPEYQQSRRTGFMPVSESTATAPVEAPRKFVPRREERYDYDQAAEE